MTIGFDAKRAFFNQSGLGNYSRDVIRCLIENYPDNEYYLYTPYPKKSIPFYQQGNCLIKGPDGILHRIFPSFWRSFSIGKQLKNDHVEIYHGLSNELPADISSSGVRSVVTIHDLIFLRYPHFYPFYDTFTYRQKIYFACRHADAIVAVSEQTRKDIIEYLKIPPSRITVIYQSCNPIFYQPVNEHQKQIIRERYQLPREYILFVGTIEERKNLLSLVKAIHQQKIDMPLVVIGKETPYALSVYQHIRKYRLSNIWFLKKVPTPDMPAIFQMATVFVYPSLFEGFGIPILEALYSRVPVITNKGGCFSEAGGPASLYVDCKSPEAIGNAIITLINDKELRQKMIEEGYRHALQFNPQKVANNLMNLYQQL